MFTDVRFGNKFRFLLLSWVLCVNIFIRNASAQRYSFYNLSVESGLIQSQARDLAQDNQGHLWIGTLGGLSRFDGRSFTNYTIRDGMLNNTVNTITADKKGNLWIGSPKGISCFNGKGFEHFIFQSPENPAGNFVTQIRAAENGTVWCVSGNKIYSIEKGKNKQLTTPDKEAVITALLPDKGSLWAARTGGTVYHWNNKKWDSLSFNLTDPTVKPIVTKIFRDSRQRLWLTTNRGLYKVENGAIVTARVRSMMLDGLPTILSITEDKHHDIWLGMAGGAARITDQDIAFFNKKNGLCDNTIFSVLTDAEGNVWMASDGQGVFRFSGGQFTAIDESTGLPSAQVMSIGADRYGRLFFGTYDAGLYVYGDGKVLGLPFPLKSNPPITAMRFKDGNIWLGTAGAGLWKYNGINFFSYTTQTNGLVSNVVTSLYIDDKGRLWIGAPNGATYFEKDSFHAVPMKNTPVQDFINLSNDSILFGTSNGLKIFYDGNVYPYVTGQAPDSATPQCFALKGNDLWIGTSDNGLIYYNLNTRKSFVLNKSNGLQSDFIYNTIIDNEGNIWVGTGYGIHKITIKEGSKPSIYFYGKGQGLTGMESNHNAVLKMPDGSIWFGTTNGALHYRPQAKTISPMPISIVLQSIKVFGENITDSTYYDSTDISYKVPYGLHLPPQKNNITFTFQAISLSGSEQIRYRYRIDGLDAPWSDWANTNTITYSALPPGNYILRVQCNSNGSNEVLRELKYPFEIITPFHKTNLFRLIILAACILLGITIQYVANQRKLNRLRLVEKLRREEQGKVRQRTAEDFHDEVGNKLTRINVLTNVLKNKLGDLTTPDTRRILDQIQDNTGQLYSGTRDILWSLKPSNDNLYEILHRIRDFGGELFQDTEIDFIFTGTDERWRDYKMPLDISRNLIMIFKEALNNTLKYANATEVKLDVNLRADEALQLVLTDNGTGFDVQYVKRGHGIDNMNVRAARINGRLYIDSRKGKGTIINLTFKLPSKRGMNS
jgi:ligand-binding sensor domain-containing protein/signal transduction histidine kinase